MKLSNYIETEGITLAAFASRIGVTHSAVSRYVNGLRRPSWRVLQKIEAATNGAVTPNDFCDTEAA